MRWATWAESQLESIRRADRLRRLVAFDAAGVEGTVRGRRVVSFATNDYLGLTSHPEVCRAARAAIDTFGTGATSSRLIVGTRSLHEQLERELADWTGAERALVFPSGYAANLSVLTTLGTLDVTLFSDALNHASIIDGCRLAKARTAIYRHADADHLDALMRATPGRKIVVTDSVFSMDGDVAPLDSLAQLCLEHGALLVIDEAHGVLGPDFEPPEAVECVRVGTLSKTLASLGGWVAGCGALIDLLINRARPFIYTTALPPAATAAALAALRIYRSPEGAQLRAHLRSLVDQIMPAHPSPIVPLVLGDERIALEAAETLLSVGIHVPAIRPPTVPVGTSRLRIAISAAHTSAMIAQLKAALQSLVPHFDQACHSR